MLFRNLTRRLVTPVFKIKTLSNLRFAAPSKPCTRVINADSVPQCVSICNQRCYSQEVTLQTVDFDYVKKASAKEDKVVIIDVREPDEVKEHGKIPNSINIPLGDITTTLSLPEKDFQQIFNRPKPKEDTEMIFYCMIGKRSAKAQKNAADLGFKNTKNYLGSWNDWAANNK